jgi:osmoprotectant transport system substrate-binding protein
VIPAKGFVLLEDDKKLQPADNVVPVVREELLGRAPADFRTTINAVTAKLTTAELTGLNKMVEIDRKDAKDAAAAWLKEKALIR